MKPLRMPAVLTAAFGFGATVQAKPPAGTYFTAPYGPGGTWNLYQSGTGEVPWETAQKIAAEKTDPSGSGKPGHLVTIGSAAENMFVYQSVNSRFIWIGLTDSEKFGGHEAATNRKGGWRWLDGDPVTFQLWMGSEPNVYQGVDEDVVSMGPAGRWIDFPPAAAGDGHVARQAYMMEWNVNSPVPVNVPGVIKTERIMPDTWPIDFNQPIAKGEGPWSVYSCTIPKAANIRDIVTGLQDENLTEGLIRRRLPRLNYHFQPKSPSAGGWTGVADLAPFPMTDGTGVLHVATVRLDKAATWSFCLHSDDFSAVRFPGRKWKSATGMGGIDPLDPATIYFDCGCGDGWIVATIDLPAGESRVEVLLGNGINDAMMQLLAAPGEIALEGATDHWRDPGHKAGEELAWPGVDTAGWTVTRTDRTPNGPPVNNLMAGLALVGDHADATSEGVATINYVDSDSAADVKFPNPANFPGDGPGNQDQFAVRATAKLVIPKDGVYHIGVHADTHCALRIKGAAWTRLVRNTGAKGKLEGDTLHSDDFFYPGTNAQMVGEVSLQKGTYEIEGLYVDTDGPSAFSIFGAPAGFAPRLIAKDGAKIEPDIDGLPLVTP